MKANTFCHIEIPAPDLDKAKVFYEKLFQWKISIFPDRSYALFDDGLIGGGFDPLLPITNDGINLIIAVDDITGKLEEIKSAGGKVVKEKTLISEEHGYYASFLDPNGNRLSIWCKN